MPMVSYDVPVTNNANVYLVLVILFVEEDGKPPQCNEEVDHRR